MPGLQEIEICEPFNCRIEGYGPLLKLSCQFCGMDFYICRRCYRGQKYCCYLCRLLGYLEKRRQAQQRYRQTPKGKKAHCVSENHRRQRKKPCPEKNMDDGTTLSLSGWVIMLFIWLRCIQDWMTNPNLPPRCRFCGCPGQIVTHFPRRGYG